jgi:hypothetical protein
VAWAALKAKLTPLPKKHKKRQLQPLYDALNEAKGYNFLVRMGCTNVHFIPVSTTKGQKTPDLGADAEGHKVLCDVKTINVSEEEVERRLTGGVGKSTSELDRGFFDKLKSDIDHAKVQMVIFNPDNAVRKIAYIVVNYDDYLHEYADRYWPQIVQFIANYPIHDLEVEFDIKPPFSLARA